MNYKFRYEYSSQGDPIPEAETYEAIAQVSLKEPSDLFRTWKPPKKVIDLTQDAIEKILDYSM